MGFKVSTVMLAHQKGKLVFDFTRKFLAEVRYDSSSGKYSLKYLDGYIVNLGFDRFLQMEPQGEYYPHVPTKVQCEIAKQDLLVLLRVHLDDILYGSDFLSELTKEKLRQDALESEKVPEEVS